MTSEHEDWIAPTGVRAIDPDATHTAVPVNRMLGEGLSLEAVGLYGWLLSYQGVPMNPLDHFASSDTVEETQAAITELIEQGYIVRVPPPTEQRRTAT